MKVQHAASGRGFEITPLLDRGWGYDPYVQNLIGRIRAGRPSLECLFDSNNLWLRSGQDSELQRTAFKKREITAQEWAEYHAEQEKLRLANEAEYARQAADRAAKKAEREREEKAWRARRAATMRQMAEQKQEWAFAQPRYPPSDAPRPKSVGVCIPTPGWWREQGGDVVVAVMLQRHTAKDVLVGPEGAGLWLAKGQIKLVKNYLNGLHELTLDGELAKRLGFCKGEPTAWIS